jgi:predicted dehydrogenase
MGRKHLQVLSNLNEYDVGAVCDTSVSRLKELSSRLPDEIGIFSSPRKMIAETDLDLLVVSTPPTSRLEIILEALRCNIAVLSEKPLAADLETADKIVKTAQDTGTFLAVHHQNRVSPALNRCRELINEGLIGDVRLLHGRGKGGRPASIELMEIGVHLADMMTVLAGQAQWCSASLVDGPGLATAAGVRPSRELSPLDPDFGPATGTLVMASFGFEGGVLAEMCFYGHERGMPENLGITIVGTAGQLALHCSRHVKRQLWHLPHPMPGTPEQSRDWQEVPISAETDGDLVVAHYLELAQALDGDSTRVCTGDGGRAALEMVLAAYHSHRAEGRRIALPLSDRQHPLKGWID